MYKLKRYYTYVQLTIRSRGKNVDYFPYKIEQNKNLKISSQFTSQSSLYPLLAIDHDVKYLRQMTHNRSRSSILNHWRWPVSFISFHFASTLFINARSIQRWRCNSMHDADQFLMYEEWWSYDRLRCGNFWDFTMSFCRRSKR